MTRLFECRALAKRYGRTQALAGLDLELARGAPIALVGPNGAGKTTLFSVLCGFVRATSGQARVLGEPVGTAALRGRIGALPQDASLAPGFAVRSQLVQLARLQGMNRSAAAREADRVLERVQLADAGDSAPESLSHGMRKRVAFAQALLGEPELLLLDEPTAGVDPPNVRIIHALIRELGGSVDFLISSHNLDELERLTERVVYLENGRVSTRGERADDERAVGSSGSPVLGKGGGPGRLTVTLSAGQASEAAAATLGALVGALAGVQHCQVTERGDLVLSVDDEDAGAQAVIAALAARGIRWRQIARGRSLEARLYDD